MSVRINIHLDEDALERAEHESRSRGASFGDTLNDLLRTAPLQLDEKSRSGQLAMKPVRMGYRAGLNYDDVESLLEYGEGKRHL